MTKANECTCPSGDGSLRHPCPAHPTVEQAGGDERVIGWRERILAAHPNSDPGFWPDALLVEHMAAEIADLRAALAQLSPASDLDPLNLAPHVEAFNEAPAEALKPEQAEAERPEVVARVVHPNPVVLDQCGPLNANDELMTVAQHAASVVRWAEMFNRVEQQRDAALARVAGLEAKLGKLEKQEPVAVVKGDGSLGAGFPSGTKLYAAPVAQAQQLNDLDKQCRDDVARALGLRPNQERGFAWSYLLASIKSCVKASGDSAQAKHSVPEEFSFEYRHPNGESHTVTVSRDQVINEMPDFLFEALCSKFCNCEPAGETNVVECCCDEYAEEFKLLAAAPGNSAQHSVPEGLALIPVRETEAMHDAVMALLYKGVARTDTQKLLDAYIAAAPGKEGV
ncbi:TPA: hypothetical protein ACXI4M_003892 [Pseudomonas aeruginosa]